MTGSDDATLLAQCFQDLSGTNPSSVVKLMAHASERRIYRLTDLGRSVIGVVNSNLKENEAFVYLAGHFKKFGIPVPDVYCYRPAAGAYLLQDLGDLTLLDYLQQERAATGVPFPTSAREAYQATLEWLPRIQFEAGSSVDFSRCFPESDFSSDALRADMQAFARELVKRLLSDFSVSELDSEFEQISSFAAGARATYFLYRDFQSRNIMLLDGRPYFIDFQGGRRGPLQYDVVSLLYQSSAQIPEDNRRELLQHYLGVISKLASIDPSDFYRYYNCFIVGRMLQVLGVYGRQGLGVGKEYFAKSIPGALRTLRGALESAEFPLALPRLHACVRRLEEKVAVA